MTAIIVFLLCGLAFALYLLNENNNENLELKRKLREKENSPKEITHSAPEKIREVVVVKPVYVAPPVKKPSTPLLPEAQRFVQVIFKKNGKKRYDYYLGDNHDIKVGDFVEVWANNKRSGKSEWKVVKVVYVSKPGEVSSKANSTIIRKAAYPKWN